VESDQSFYAGNGKPRIQQGKDDYSEEKMFRLIRYKTGDSKKLIKAINVRKRGKKTKGHGADQGLYQKYSQLVVGGNGVKSAEEGIEYIMVKGKKNSRQGSVPVDRRDNGYRIAEGAKAHRR